MEKKSSIVNMRYQGPLYRPPSEADSLLIQATVGCPHNRCTFCMIYKNGPRFKIRSFEEIESDMKEAARTYGNRIRTLFFPSGNTIAMPTPQLADICRMARKIFPHLERITVYGSSQYIHRKGLTDLKLLAAAGLNRIHVGLETGDDTILARIKKGTHRREQIEAGQWVKTAGIELSEYVILGIAGQKYSREHATHTASALNAINPDFIRLRTFVPKVNTPLLEEVEKGKFQMLGPHDILKETAILVDGLAVTSQLTSDHYTNYINLKGRLPEAKTRLMQEIECALQRDESTFRAFFIGTQ